MIVKSSRRFVCSSSEDEVSSEGDAGDEPGDEGHAAAGYRPHGGGEPVDIICNSLLVHIQLVAIPSVGVPELSWEPLNSLIMGSQI